MRYAIAYRLGLTPWERYGVAAADSIKALLDREEAERTRPLGRALDVGCGRGQYTAELARRGWSAVGIDVVPRAIAVARRRGGPGVTYSVGDGTDLAAADLGMFDFFLDVGCFQGLRPVQRRAAARGVTALAYPGATVLMLAFQPTRARTLLEGVSQAEVEEAFACWEMISVQAADTTGLGWPMSTTTPQWYRLRRRDATRPPARAGGVGAGGDSRRAPAGRGRDSSARRRPRLRCRRRRAGGAAGRRRAR